MPETQRHEAPIGEFFSTSATATLENAQWQDMPLDQARQYFAPSELNPDATIKCTQIAQRGLIISVTTGGGTRYYDLHYGIEGFPEGRAVEWR